MPSTSDTSPASSTPARPGEDYLRAHHDANPGRQSVGSKDVRDANGRSSYDVVAGYAAGARSVLDLGCADGWLLELIAANGAERLAGIDLSDGELAFARRRPALAGADLRQGRAQELPWPDESFDAVVTHMALMLMDDVERVAAEVARVLTPGGVFVSGIGGGPVPGEGLELFLNLAKDYRPEKSEQLEKLESPEKSERPEKPEAPEKLERPEKPEAPEMPGDPEKPAAPAAPRLGDKRTRTRAGLDEILTPAGFEPVSWEPVHVDLGGEPEHAWHEHIKSYYGMSVMPEEQKAEFLARFLEAAKDLLRPDGHLPCGMIINVAAATRRKS